MFKLKGVQQIRQCVSSLSYRMVCCHLSTFVFLYGKSLSLRCPSWHEDVPVECTVKTRVVCKTISVEDFFVICCCFCYKILSKHLYMQLFGKFLLAFFLNLYKRWSRWRDLARSPRLYSFGGRHAKKLEFPYIAGILNARGELFVLNKRFSLITRTAVKSVQPRRKQDCHRLVRKHLFYDSSDKNSLCIFWHFAGMNFCFNAFVSKHRAIFSPFSM